MGSANMQLSLLPFSLPGTSMRFVYRIFYEEVYMDDIDFVKIPQKRSE